QRGARGGGVSNATRCRDQISSGTVDYDVPGSWFDCDRRQVSRGWWLVNRRSRREVVVSVLPASQSSRSRGLVSVLACQPKLTVRGDRERVGLPAEAHGRGYS